MFGSHLSIAGGLHNAVETARGYGMTAVQLFTKNQQQWRCPPLGRGDEPHADRHRQGGLLPA